MQVELKILFKSKVLPWNGEVPETPYEGLSIRLNLVVQQPHVKTLKNPLINFQSWWDLCCTAIKPIGVKELPGLPAQH